MTEHEELLKLRALAEKQQKEIKAKDKIIQKQNIQIENMIQALLHARKKLFGPSTEVSQMEGQLSLFTSMQDLAGGLFKEKKEITVPSYTRTARKSGVREEMLAGLPQEVEEYVIPAKETCSKCGGELIVIGKKVVRTEVEFEPAKLKVKQIIQQVAPESEKMYLRIPANVQNVEKRERQKSTEQKKSIHERLEEKKQVVEKQPKKRRSRDVGTR